MSTARAAVTGVLIVVVAFLALVYVPNLVLTKASGLDRSGRVLVATVWFTVAVVGLLWALRRLQARRVI